MSYKKLWPDDDMVFDSPKDVVLVLHLATLAGGHNPSINLAARPTPTRTSHAFLRCVEPKKPHRTGCQATLLYLEYLKKGNPNGLCKIHLPPRQKEATKLCDHHSQPDSGHSEYFGFMEPAQADLHLKVSSTKVYDKKGVALIEAGLKASGRRRGYAIQSRHTKDVLVKCLGEGPTGPCKWQVRLVPAPNNHGHTISEIDPNHQCDPTLVLPGSNLKRVLDFFPEVSLEAGLIGKSKRQQVRKKPKGPDGAPAKPKQQRARKSIAPTPDYSGFSDEEDGVMGDQALSRRVMDLIKICPPDPEGEEVPIFPSFESIVYAMKEHLALQSQNDTATPTAGESSDAPSPTATSDAGGATDASTTKVKNRPKVEIKSKKSKYDIPEDDIGRQARRNAAIKAESKSRQHKAGDGTGDRSRDKSSSLSPLPLPEDDDGDSYHSDEDEDEEEEDDSAASSVVDDDDDDDLKPRRKRTKTSHNDSAKKKKRSASGRDTRAIRDSRDGTPVSARASSSRGAAQLAQAKISRSASAQALALAAEEDANGDSDDAKPTYEPYRVEGLPDVSAGPAETAPVAGVNGAAHETAQGPVQDAPTSSSVPQERMAVDEPKQ